MITIALLLLILLLNAVVMPLMISFLHIVEQVASAGSSSPSNERYKKMAKRKGMA
jgi:hypothetical protein